MDIKQEATEDLKALLCLSVIMPLCYVGVNCAVTSGKFIFIN